MHTGSGHMIDRNVDVVIVNVVMAGIHAASSARQTGNFRSRRKPVGHSRRRRYVLQGRQSTDLLIDR